MSESNLSDLMSSLGALLCIIPVIIFVIWILIIIAYIKTYQRIKNISDKVDIITDRINNTKRDDTEKFLLDHCYMNRFYPHEWYPTSNNTEQNIEFQCAKCGKKLIVPKTGNVNLHH